MEENVEMITISKKEYEELIKNDLWVTALDSAGVDNWEGIDYAIEYYNELIKDYNNL